MDNSSRDKLAVFRVTFDDLPALAEAEILAFLNDEIVSTIVYPNRWALRSSGAPIRAWPDYGDTIERRKRDLVSNEILYKVVRKDDNQPLGMVSISFPGSRRDRTWSDWLWGDYIYPILKAMGLCEEGKSLNKEFSSLYLATTQADRERLLQGKVHAAINHLSTHPDARGTGAGTMLIEHCISLATAEGLPIVLESSEAAFEFYKKRGFKQVGVGKIECRGSEISWPIMIWEPV